MVKILNMSFIRKWYFIYF